MDGDYSVNALVPTSTLKSDTCHQALCVNLCCYKAVGFKQAEGSELQSKDKPWTSAKSPLLQS